MRKWVVGGEGGWRSCQLVIVLLGTTASDDLVPEPIAHQHQEEESAVFAADGVSCACAACVLWA